MCITALAILLLISVATVLFVRHRNEKAVNLYKIEINRVENELKVHAGEKGFVAGDSGSVTEDSGFVVDVSKYETITGVTALTVDNAERFYRFDSDYCIVDVEGTLWRIDYSVDNSGERKTLFMAVNLVIAVIFATVILIFIYIYFAVVRTFNRIAEYPKELAKGNLTLPMTEQKNKYFGRFLWGLDMLREQLEGEKKKNLELEKEKNVFLLSLSHDIKTPISAIKLYAAALKKNLYRDEDKLKEVAEKLDGNAEEIEKYVARIISSSGEDFLDLDVKTGEFYLSEAMGPVKEYYSDKLSTVGTELTIEKFSDVLLQGDRDRFTEVLQNIFENAIKYGDGGYIRVSFADEEDARLITVANSGCNLPESEAEHIFESFYRGSNVGSKPGSGLGLYIARQLMRKMGGEIFAEIVGPEPAGPEMRITLVLHKTA